MRINPIFKQLAEGSIYLTAFGLVVWSMNRPHDDSFYRVFDLVMAIYCFIVTSLYAYSKRERGGLLYSILVLCTLATGWNLKDILFKTHTELSVSEIVFAFLLLGSGITILYRTWKHR